MPSGNILTISEKRYIFSIRNRMVQIPANFPIRNKNTDKNCQKCGERENMKHIYICKLKQEETEVEYETIFGENLKQMKKVYSQFKINYENREKQKTIVFNPRDPNCDPLISLESSDGNID